MFSLKPKDELVFGSESDKLILDDLITDPAFLESNIVPNKTQMQIQFGNQEIKKDMITNDRKNIRTKIIHRDLERQRRQEMAQLHASLRSLLPLDHIKGKRSICDDLHKAVNYVKDMQNNIHELQIRRDKLKKLSNLSAINTENSSKDTYNSINRVVVNLNANGVEILISSSDLKLSRVLHELMRREMNVVVCVSTKVQEKFLHKIQTEGADLTNLDISLMQERLTHLIN